MSDIPDNAATRMAPANPHAELRPLVDEIAFAWECVSAYNEQVDKDRMQRAIDVLMGRVR